VLPNLIVIGAMKCATTSLHYYLSLHPDLYMTPEKELHFFVEERNWPKGVTWYERHFRRAAAVRGESSTTYTRFPHILGVPARMRTVVPDARLIYIVRDPIDRVVSHYVHEYAAGREHRTLEVALETLVANPYVDLSRYYMQIAQFFEHYPRSRFLVITAEGLSRRPRETMERVYRFLGVRDSFRDDRFAVRKHASEDKRRLTPSGAALAWLPETWLARRVHPAARRYAWRLITIPLSTAVERPVLCDALRGRLRDALQDDVDHLRPLVDDADADWLR
jgi:hypothetical protein